MFNKKFINILSWIVGVAFFIQLLGSIVLFVWSQFEPPKLPPLFFQIMSQGFESANLLLAFVVLAGVRGLALNAPEKPKKKGFFKKD